MMGHIGSFLLMYRSHDMRHTRFRMLRVVNGTPGFWGVTALVGQVGECYFHIKIKWVAH